VQETLHFDPQSGSLTSLRSKEEAHDYRYFPEPDLVPIAPTAEILREVGELLPELPLARIERYREQLGLSAEAARLFAEDPPTAEYFEQALAAGGAIEPRVIENWVSGELAAALRQAGESHGPVGSKVSPDALAALVVMVVEDQISHASAKGVISTLVAEGGDPSDIVAREGLSQISDSGELEAIVEAALAENPEAVTQIQSGNGKAIGVLIGAVMKQTQGRADGGLINRLITEKLMGRG
jgi:aspartyl-tRNA(Asn)/glutamyl-tRNA(Gln) amidotransferase subunit B